MSIKKSYVKLVELLEANKDKKVSSILEEVYSIAESKKQSSTSIVDSEGNVIAIYCYYHKQWELISETPYGSKANSKTGYNTMCKCGTSLWTKAQRDAKNAKAQLLEDVSSGKIQPSDILKLQDDIEAKRKTIDTTDMPKGHTLEEVESMV